MIEYFAFHLGCFALIILVDRFIDKGPTSFRMVWHWLLIAPIVVAGILLLVLIDLGRKGNND